MHKLIPISDVSRLVAHPIMQWLGFWWVNIKPVLVPFHHNSKCTSFERSLGPKLHLPVAFESILQINLLLPESVPWNTNGESPTKDDQVLWLLLEGLNRRARDFALDNDQQGIIIFLNDADNLINIFKGYGQISYFGEYLVFMLRDDWIYGHRHSFTESNGSKQQANEQLSSSLHASCEVNKVRGELKLAGQAAQNKQEYYIPPVKHGASKGKGRNRKPSTDKIQTPDSQTEEGRIVEEVSSSRAGKPKVKSANGTKCHPLV